MSVLGGQNSMSATATYPNGGMRTEEPESVCRILILHEAFSAYTRATDVCRRVMEQLAGELDFDIKCWSFTELADATCARQAAKMANAADVILLALQTGGVPQEFQGWLDQFPLTRSKDDGLLALLVEDLNGPASALECTMLRMNDWAARLGVDVVTLFPDGPATVGEPLRVPIWHALAPAREQADSPTLDHWGLNE